MQIALLSVASLILSIVSVLGVQPVAFASDATEISEPTCQSTAEDRPADGANQPCAERDGVVLQMTGSCENGGSYSLWAAGIAPNSDVDFLVDYPPNAQKLLGLPTSDYSHINTHHKHADGNGQITDLTWQCSDGLMNMPDPPADANNPNEQLYMMTLYVCRAGDGQLVRVVVPFGVPD